MTPVLCVTGVASAAVSMMEGCSGVQGVTRMVQVDNDTCVVEGTVDGLSPGSYNLRVHMFGDLTRGCDRLMNLTFCIATTILLFCFLSPVVSLLFSYRLLFMAMYIALAQFKVHFYGD